MLVISSRAVTEDDERRAALDARRQFEAVITDDPTYADAHCLYAVTAARFLARTRPRRWPEPRARRASTQPAGRDAAAWSSRSSPRSTRLDTSDPTPTTRLRTARPEPAGLTSPP